MYPDEVLVKCMFMKHVQKQLNSCEKTQPVFATASLRHFFPLKFWDSS